VCFGLPCSTKKMTWTLGVLDAVLFKKNSSQKDVFYGKNMKITNPCPAYTFVCHLCLVMKLVSPSCQQWRPGGPVGRPAVEPFPRRSRPSRCWCWWYFRNCAVEASKITQNNGHVIIVKCVNVYTFSFLPLSYQYPVA